MALYTQTRDVKEIILVRGLDTHTGAKQIAAYTSVRITRA